MVKLVSMRVWASSSIFLRLSSLSVFSRASSRRSILLSLLIASACIVFTVFSRSKFLFFRFVRSVLMALNKDSLEGLAIFGDGWGERDCFVDFVVFWCFGEVMAFRLSLPIQHLFLRGGGIGRGGLYKQKIGVSYSSQEYMRGYVISPF